MFPNTLTLTTWNVLHRVHGVNWQEPCIAAFPEEKHRNAGIATSVVDWLDADIDAVCMQEVSGDQLAAIRVELAARGNGHVSIFEHVVPRLPRLRREDCTTLEDAKERLVILTRTVSARFVRSATFEKDPGKGFLIVDLGGVHLIDTHVSYGPRAPAQLALLRAAAEAAPHAVIVGDYNAPSKTLASAFGKYVAISDLGGALTRVPHGKHAGSTIDHVAVRGGTISDETVLDGRGLSDHSPVRAKITFR